MGKNNRKQILIDPPFQFSFMGHSLLMLLSLIATFFIFKNHVFNKVIEVATAAGVSESSQFFIVLHEQKQMVDMTFWISALFASFFISLWSIYISHKVAGPIFSIKRTLLEIVESRKVKNTSVRDNDYFHDFNKVMNDFIDSVDQLKENSPKQD